MKKFVKKILVFSLVFILVLYFLQFLIALRISNKTITGYDNLELTSNKNAEIVFIGSSRCWAHFDPVFFSEKFTKKSINLGVDGHTELPMAYNRLIDYMDNNITPKFVILSFDPFVRGGDFYTPTVNSFHKDDFARYSFKLFNENWKTVDHFGFNNYEKLVPLYAIFKYKQIRNILFMDEQFPYIKYGYEKHNEKWDTIKIPVTDYLKSKYFDNKELESVKKSLLDLNEYCKKNNIILICIQTPVYNSIYSKSKFDQSEKICEDLDIPFVDSNIENIRNDINYFYNSNHLNSLGVDEMNNYFSNNVLLNTILNN